MTGGINTKASAYVNSPNEFRDIRNMHYSIPGALSKRPGSSLYLGATVSGRITGGVEFEKLSGASYLVVTANTNAYTVTSSYSAFKTGLLNGALFDFVTFVDRLFCANGQDFFKFDGSAATPYSLPPGDASGFGLTAVAGGSLTQGVTTTFFAAYGYLNDAGYYGPPSRGITITIDGVTNNSIKYYGMTTPAGFGISAISLYRSSSNNIDLTGTTLALSNATTVTDTGFTLGSMLAPTSVYFTLVPRYFEIFNNQLFMAGVSSTPSTAYWSDIGKPESVQPEFFAEFRTNDGDRVTGMKAYNGALIVTKERSFHRVTGDNPDNFFFQEISDQYGCLSNRAMVTFENRFWFLDPKGIVEFNGANIQVVSNKIEPIIQSMNVEAARENACAIHNRNENEVWFSIPCNGATLNNTTLVFDYLSNAWTIYDGFNVSSLWVAKQSQPKKTPFYGGYTGNIFYFGASLMNDNGAAIPCSFETRFLAESGQTVERQYRRFYLNVSPVLGITQSITCEFRQDYASLTVATREMFQSQFQTRVDFGIPAKSIQAKVSHVSASFPITINGYTFESRFQRNT